MRSAARAIEMLGLGPVGRNVSQVPLASDLHQPRQRQKSADGPENCAVRGGVNGARSENLTGSMESLYW